MENKKMVNMYCWKWNIFKFIYFSIRTYKQYINTFIWLKIWCPFIFYIYPIIHYYMFLFLSNQSFSLKKIDTWYIIISGV